MRPASIVTFERIVLLIVVLSAASAVLTWDATAAQLSAGGVGEGILFGALAVLLGLILLLSWLIARRRSNIARWLYVLLMLGTIGVSVPALPRLIEGSTVNLVLNIAFLLICLLSVVLLFRPDNRGWFGRSDAAAG